MIYLLDQKLRHNSHSRFIIDVIKNHTTVDTTLIEISKNETVGAINKILFDLFPKVLPIDIVLCPWAVPANNDMDTIFDDLSDLCWVVAAAGNQNQSIEHYSPARVENVITVGCLNKSGVKATLSNYSDTKELMWVPGTNYTIGSEVNSGTSISAALYAAFLAEALKENNIDLLETLIQNQKQRVLQELETKT